MEALTKILFDNFDRLSKIFFSRSPYYIAINLVSNVSPAITFVMKF